MTHSSLEDNAGRATLSAQLTILLIADALVRIVLKQLLRDAHEVVIVGETVVDQALPVARRTAPDVALVDELHDPMRLVEQGNPKPVMHEVFAVEAAMKAQDVMEKSEHLGKLVLHVTND